MKTKTKGSYNKKPKPNLNGPNSPTSRTSNKDGDLDEGDQKQITNTDSENLSDAGENGVATMNGNKKSKKEDGRTL